MPVNAINKNYGEETMVDSSSQNSETENKMCEKLLSEYWSKITRRVGIAVVERLGTVAGQEQDRSRTRAGREQDGS